MNVKSRTLRRFSGANASVLFLVLFVSTLPSELTVIFPENHDSRCINVAPPGPGIAYTGNLFCSIHRALSPRFQTALSDGGGLSVELLSVIKNTRASGMSACDAASNDRVHSTDTHGANAME